MRRTPRVGAGGSAARKEPAQGLGARTAHAPRPLRRLARRGLLLALISLAVYGAWSTFSHLRLASGRRSHRAVRSISNGFEQGSELLASLGEHSRPQQARARSQQNQQGQLRKIFSHSLLQLSTDSTGVCAPYDPATSPLHERYAPLSPPATPVAPGWDDPVIEAQREAKRLGWPARRLRTLVALIPPPSAAAAEEAGPSAALMRSLVDWLVLTRSYTLTHVSLALSNSSIPEAAATAQGRSLLLAKALDVLNVGYTLSAATANDSSALECALQPLREAPRSTFDLVLLLDMRDGIAVCFNDLAELMLKKVVERAQVACSLALDEGRDGTVVLKDSALRTVDDPNVSLEDLPLSLALENLTQERTPMEVASCGASFAPVLMDAAPVLDLLTHGERGSLPSRDSLLEALRQRDMRHALVPRAKAAGTPQAYKGVAGALGEQRDKVLEATIEWKA